MNLKEKLNIYEPKPANIGSGEDRTDKSRVLEDIGGEKILSEGIWIWRFRSAESLDVLTRDLDKTLSVKGLEYFLKYSKIKDNLFLNDLLFFDLETTSLSIGTGNYPFLIGLGFLEDDKFITEQFFLDDFTSEEYILRFLLKYFKRSRAVVSFNGKTFDVPLIKNRYRLNRVPDFPVDITVIDLLYSCRRIFKRVYESCSLKTMEERVLGFAREDDIPGWLIPDVFFSYQKSGETEKLPSVVEHNKFDIQSMLLLLFVLNNIYACIEERDYKSFQDRSLINIANYLFKINVNSFLDLADFIGNDIFLERTLFKKYSSALKRTGRSNDAVELWGKDGSLFSLEEMSKHYEHKEKDYARALEFCNQAFGLIQKGCLCPRGEKLTGKDKGFYSQRFTKRTERLKGKMGKQNF